MINNNSPQSVSIVVIGKNEANNLDATFQAINNINFPKNNFEVIYVDTNSTDNSVEIAKIYTNKVFTEKREWSTPGLARNKGIIEAKFEIVHFLDGDITIDKEYIKKAVDKIQEPNIDSVYGYLEEKSKEGVNDVLLAHWAGRKEGYHEATGAGGTYLKSALLTINGYDERIRKGQETELGERFLDAGFKIWFMNEPMGIHDYGVRKLTDLVKIFYLDGICKSHLYMTNGKTNFYIVNKKKAISNFLFFILFSIILLVLLFFFGSISLIYSILIYFGYFIFKYVIIKKLKDPVQLKYFLIIYTFRIFTLFGQIRFYLKSFNSKYRNSVILEKDILS